MASAALRIVDDTIENKIDPSLIAGFQDFWELYPRREARKDAVKAWDRIGPADRVAALVALLDWRRVWQARADYRYTPLPATWLNGERWTDELPAEHRQVATSASHVIANLPEHDRGEMPAKVREMLAKLRGGK